VGGENAKQWATKKKESIQAAAWKSEALLKATLSTKQPA